MKKLLSVVLFVLAATPAISAPRVCAFLGDSITAGVRKSPTVTEKQRFTYLVAKRKKCKEVNAGVGSDTTTLMLERFDRDVAQHKPNLIYVMSENDYWPLSKISLEESEKNIREIIGKAKAIGAEVQIVTPPPVGVWDQVCGAPIPRDSCKKLEAQRELEPSYIEMQRRVAKETGVQLIDVYKAKWTGKHFQDPWHPNVTGQKLIADMLD